MTQGVTAQRLFDGTFSTDAVATAAHALVQQLHDDAMATIAALADSWGRPAEDPPAVDDEPVTYRDPASWSVQDDDELVDDDDGLDDDDADDDDADDDDADDDDADDDGADDEVRVRRVAALPALLPLPRRHVLAV
jgi:hypothetical protein